ncbi:MAG: DUF6020 family protein [Lachnospiraceae bacterium]|nr:DUF6020 family protein [Lachnospiraceae bacterium]
MKCDTKRILLFSCPAGLVCGFLLEYGSLLEAGESILKLRAANLWHILVYSIIAGILVGFLLTKIKYRENPGNENGTAIFRRKWFLLCWLSLFICWIPAFLAYYPTIWAYDVYSQVPDITGGVLTTHHPLLHTLYIETIVQIGSNGNDYETGMVLLSLTQMCALSGMFAYGLEKVRAWGCGKVSRGILFCFFAFFPVNSILSVSMTKDVLFAGCVLVCVLKFYDMADNPALFFHSKKKWISFLVFVCLMCSLRNNGIYVFAAVMILGIFLWRREYRKRFLLLCGAGICVYALFQFSLYRISGASNGSEMEAYSVPMQCLVGTAIRHPELIPAYGTGQMLMDAIPRDIFPENLSDSYGPHNVDFVKARWEEDAQGEGFDSVRLLKAWIKYGLKYPLDYLDIWGTLTLGAWYPFDTTHANIYSGERQGYLLTDFKIVPGMNTERPASKWPALEALYEKIATENVHQTIPVISLFFAPATYCWIMFFAILHALYWRKYRELLPLGVLFFYWGTVLLGPTIIVRYLYAVIVSVPFVLCRMSVCKREPALK